PGPDKKELLVEYTMKADCNNIDYHEGVNIGRFCGGIASAKKLGHIDEETFKAVKSALESRKSKLESECYAKAVSNLMEFESAP
ncbi:MAG: hypothetical protein R2688_08535, partial [Fimbriimonadaceae bacterium]